MGAERGYMANVRYRVSTRIAELDRSCSVSVVFQIDCFISNCMPDVTIATVLRTIVERSMRNQDIPFLRGGLNTRKNNILDFPKCQLLLRLLLPSRKPQRSPTSFS